MDIDYNGVYVDGCTYIMPKRVYTHVWADGYGLWHARVTGAKDAANAKLHASRAIRQALMDEMPLGSVSRGLGNLKLVVDTLNHIPGSITYQEAG